MMKNAFSSFVELLIFCKQKKNGFEKHHWQVLWWHEAVARAADRCMIYHDDEHQ